MHARRFIAFLILMSLSTLCLGQKRHSDDWFFRAWQTEDGLPDNSISGIAQSPDGYLWLGTNGGAIRFNGNQFSNLPLRDRLELPSRQVHAMFLDREGNLWLGMERGPVIRVQETSFQAFTHADGIPNTRPTSIADDPKGRLWIGFASGACRIDGDEVTVLGPAQQSP